MMIHIFSDLICPWCLIGKRRLEAALSQRPDVAAKVIWQPFQLNPDMPRDGFDRQQYIEWKFGGAERAKMFYKRIEDTAAEDGIEIRFDRIRRTPNTIDGHRAVLFSAGRGKADEMTESLFQAYFQDGEDIGDRDLLVEKAAALGLDRTDVADYLSSDTDVDLIREVDLSARQGGVDGVPCFIIENKYAVQGAQPPEVLVDVIDRIRELDTAEPVDAGG